MDRYKVVIIGAGRIGALFDAPESEKVLTHAHAFYLDERFELLGFYDCNFEYAKIAAMRWGGEAFTTLDEAMQEAEIVSCCVPDEFHYDVLKKISEYPIKFVFCEKPITKEVWQAEEICELYKQKGIPLQVNYSRSFLKEYTELAANIKEYGKLINGVGYYVKGIIHSGSHMIDLILKLLGEIEKVEGYEKKYDFYDDDPSVEAKINVSHSMIHLHPIDFNVVAMFEMDLFFEKMRIRIVDSGNIIEFHPVTPSDIYEGYYYYVYDNEKNVNYDLALVNAIDNIFMYLNGGCEMLCSMEKAKTVLQICDEIRGK